MTVEMPSAININMMFRDKKPYYKGKDQDPKKLTKNERHSFLVEAAANPRADVVMRKDAAKKSTKLAIKFNSIAVKRVLFQAYAPNTKRRILMAYFQISIG